MMKFSLTKRRVSRSFGGDLFIFVILAMMAAFMAIPMVLAISNAFKPLNEFFLFPPRLIVRNPTMDNFLNLFTIMGGSWVPLSRYLLNSLIIVFFGTAGNVLFASLAAYAISKHKFPGPIFSWA